MEIEIGYLCGRGHYCFYADSGEDGACGSKRIGAITLMLDEGVDADEALELHTEADIHLGQVIDTWRMS